VEVRPAHVLVVDDDDSILKMFESALAKSFRVSTAVDGSQARAQLEKHDDIAVVVADQMMPGMTGVELCREAITLRPSAARILITASDRVEDLSNAVNIGRVHRFLSKPVRLVDLVEVVKEAARTALLESENARLVGELAERNRLLTKALAAVQEIERRLERQIEERTKELVEANKELEKLALRDGLTGLYNHRFFQEALTTELARAARYGTPLSLIFLDVDHFKNFNDMCGHSAGDDLLRQLARLLIATEDAPEVRFRGRLSDIAARYGGEEFVVILPMTPKQGGLVRAERLRELIATHPFPHREVQPNRIVSVSVGVAGYPEDAVDKVSLIQFADDAMYAAKRAGRNRVAAAGS
jgi:diguanylate cyclase (GGDEF)-like protein